MLTESEMIKGLLVGAGLIAILGKNSNVLNVIEEVLKANRSLNGHQPTAVPVSPHKKESIEYWEAPK